MSIHGEFDRYVDSLLSLLRDPTWRADAALAETLRNCRNAREELSIRARRLLETLESTSFRVWLEESSHARAAECRDVSERLATISKIILGQ